MKKFTIIAITVIFALFSLISCQGGPFGKAAGSAQAEEMLSFLPKDMNAVFFIDVQGILTLESVDKLITEKTEDEEFEKFTDYQKFVDMTGIDLKKDIYFVAAAMKEGTDEKDDWGVGIVNLKYDKDMLISFIKTKTEEEGDEFIEEQYNGYTLYTVKEKDEEISIFLIDDSNIAAGNIDIVKSVINVLQKTEEPILKNEDFSALFKDTDKSALFWGGILIPPNVTAELTKEMPMASNLESIQAVSLSFDYKNRTIMAEIKLRSSDPIENQEIADNLIGLKDMGAMITIQDFNFAEVLDRIEITSSPDHVRIYASYPDDFFNDFMSKFTLKESEEEK
ncbi:MAG: DUF3352 domain-containing protein [Candidatus Aminicenantes bacterium]|jgi:hypothetical protein